jgi:hypothetical protein
MAKGCLKAAKNNSKSVMKLSCAVDKQASMETEASQRQKRLKKENNP